MRKGRLIFILALTASWVLALLFRLYDLQVRRHAEFSERAEEQQKLIVVLEAPRGTIYDARGRELAVSVEVDSVAAHPQDVEDAEATAKALGKALGWRSKRVQDLAQDLLSDREFVWIQRKVDPPISAKIRELKLPGITFLPESKRYYPLREVAAPVLGYVGTDKAGLAGLEFLYDDTISGSPGRRTVMRDARRGTLQHPDLELSAPQPGSNLHLTLDATIQHLVEHELEKAVRTHRAKRGSVVVMEPRSGAILAMASYPSFDPNHFGDSPAENWRNQPVMDAYEPGSTFKMITLAAALEAGATEPERLIDCEMGGITLHRVRISDHKPFPVLSVRDVIAKSSNVGAIKLGFAAGRQRLYDTLRAFGFGQRTGIDLPSESPGLLRRLERWSELTPAYVSFGQGISVTSIQLATAFSAIANGGRLLKPYIVAESSENGATEQRRTLGQRKIVNVPISPSSVQQIYRILAGVVEEGTATRAQVAGYGAAGKTGTAQKAGKRGYEPNKYIAGFVGFAPLHDPALVATVMIDEPWPAYHGGEAAAPVFQAIAQQILLYLGIAPRRELQTSWPGQTFMLAKDEPAASASEPEPLPPGTVPNFLGLSARQAIHQSNGLGLQIALRGHGRVRQQQPVAGTPLEAAGEIELWLSAEAL